MSDAGKAARAARTAPDRQLDDGKDKEKDGEQLDLLDKDDGDDTAPTPEQILAEQKSQIEEMRRQSEDNRRQLEESRRQLAEERKQREDMQTGAFSAQERAITSQIDSQTQLITQAKASMRQAREAGDYEAEEKALDALTDAKAKLMALEGQKGLLEHQKRQSTQQPPQTQQTQTAPQTQQLSQPTQDWIARNPRFNSDPVFRTDAIQAAQAADSLHPRDSAAYFKFVDDVLAVKHPENGGVRKTETRRYASSTAASPSRETNVSLQRGGSVNPSAVAAKMGVTVQDLQDFAKINKMKFDDYVADQARILEEDARGQNSGLYRGNLN